MRLMLAAAAALIATAAQAAEVKLLNVSYDPTRELYQRDQPGLRRRLEGEDRRQDVTFKMSRTAVRASRARADHRRPRSRRGRRSLSPMMSTQISKPRRNLLPADWQKAAAADNSAPYYLDDRLPRPQGQSQGTSSDWGDLVKPGTQVITPNPKTSGGARWNYPRRLGSMRRSNTVRRFRRLPPKTT